MTRIATLAAIRKPDDLFNPWLGLEAGNVALEGGNSIVEGSSWRLEGSILKTRDFPENLSKGALQPRREYHFDWRAVRSSPEQRRLRSLPAARQRRPKRRSSRIPT